MFVSPAEGRVTSHYGPRERHPVTGKTGFHKGIDIAPPIAGTPGQPLYAAMDGVIAGADGSVKKVGTKWPRNPLTGTWNTGTWIALKADKKNVTLFYGHPAKVFVKEGQRVKAGDIIGEMGNVGNVTGIHLHFEVWKNHHPNNAYDPRVLFKEFDVEPGSAPLLVKSATSLTDDTPKEPEDVMNHFVFEAKDAKNRRHQYIFNPRSWTHQYIDGNKSNQTKDDYKTIVEKVGDKFYVHWADLRNTPGATDDLSAVHLLGTYIGPAEYKPVGA